MNCFSHWSACLLLCVSMRAQLTRALAARLCAVEIMRKISL